MAFEYRPTLGRPLKEVLADLTWKQKIQYVWQFYKMYILMAAAPVLIIAFAFGWSALNKTETLYNGVAVSVNVTGEGQKFLTNEMFEQMGGTNTKKQQVSFSQLDIFSTESSMESDSASSNVMTITAWLSVGEVDYMLLSEKSFEFYEKANIFSDLDTLLSDEMQQIWGDRLVEMPGDGEETYLGAIDLTGTAFAEKYVTTEGKLYIVFPGKAQRTDKLETFLNHLLSMEE